MSKGIKNHLSQIDYKLFSVLLLFGFLPTIYTSVRVFFLGDLPMDWGFNIASQISWVSLIYEVLQEGIMLPIFFLMGKSLQNKLEFENKIRTGLIITFVIYASISIILIIFVKPLLVFMSQKETLLAATSTYIRLETIASIFSTLVQFVLLIFITLKKERILLIALFVQMILSIVLDTFLVSSLPISLNIGVNGIAITNLSVNFLLLLVLLFKLKEIGFNIFKKSKLNFAWTKEWFFVGGYSGLESFIRNLAFTIMIIKMVNVVGEQGTFWVANGFIWGWLLLPILQLGQLIKRDCGEFGNRAIIEKTKGYFYLTGIIVAIWVITIPLWKPFIHYFLNIETYETVYKIALISIIFYIAFAFNNVVDSVFYGIGKTQYMLFQSIVINSVFYGSMYILYIYGIYKPTLMKIALMFSFGIFLDAILTFAIFLWLLKKRNIKLG